MEPTVTNWVEHLSAEEVAGSIYPYVGTEWLWLTIAMGDTSHYLPKQQ